MSLGISGYGVYIPRYSIKREEYVKAWGHFACAGVNEKSVAGYDEDVVTMGKEAASNALRHGGLSPEKLDAIYSGTTSPTYAEKLLSSTLASAIGVPQQVALADFGASASAGTTALLSCLDFVKSGRGKRGLAVASDAPVGRPYDDAEHGLGASAAAFVVGEEASIAQFEGTYSVGYETWADRIRRRGERFVKELGLTRLRAREYSSVISQSVRGLMEELSLKPRDFSYGILQQPDSRLPIRVARTLGFDEAQLTPGMIVSSLGDLGACSVSMGLAAVLDVASPGERVMVASYGSGACGDAFSLIIVKREREISPQSQIN
ncbi:MAG: hydroxymethylglutaryl-CoA synthase [Nitrososphaeria archaeon]|nr:hydroxymethylglutaryl-CoA synthase [Nitrososphaeria archaeon]NIN52564.1 hydroxymethylglutaryl-CoA synthase [Nitrososphaeria archaeon]NIQ33071.1 hydroxymethylglutaryl-CoA synthase [Nitrososphaeria archaeon]